MIDYDILEECGTTNERLRELFTAKLPDSRKLRKMDPKDRKALEKDVDNRKAFEDKIRSWMSEHIVFSLHNYHIYSAVDLAWDSTPINKNIYPLMMYAQGRIDQSQAVNSLKDTPEADKYVRKNDSGEVVGIDLPKFYEVNINLIRSIITRRVAAQTNKYNSLWPWASYEPRSTTLVGKLRGDALSQRVDIMADQLDYRNFQTQLTRDMFLYGHSVAFPRAAWEREVQWEKKPVAKEFQTGGKIPKRARVEKEGVVFVNPHPSRVFFDNAYPLSSINADIGCEYVGFWDLCRWGDIANNPDYFNRDQVTYSADTAAWFTQFSTYFSQYYDRIVPPPIPNDVAAPNDRKNNVGLYTGELEQTSTFITQLYVKINPRDLKVGTYPFPIWIHVKVAGDATVVHAEIMPSKPGAYFGFNENDSRLVNISVAHELMGFQDQLTNLFSQLLETAKADLFALGIINTDIFPDSPEGKKVLSDFRALMQGHNFYANTHVLEASFEKLAQLGISVSADNIFKVVRTQPNTALTAIFNAITQVIGMAERMMVLSSQEQGQPAPREISATEVNQISGSTDSIYTFISDGIDNGRAAMKRIIYESLIAKGDDEVYLPVINRYPADVIKKAGFSVVEDEADSNGGQLVNFNVTGSKHALVHDFMFSSRDGSERSPNTQSANVLGQLFGQLGGLPPEVSKPIFAAMGKEKIFEIMNEIFRMSGAGVDLKLSVKPGESDELGIEDEQQVMQGIQRLGQAVEQQQNDLAQIKQMLGIAPPGAAQPGQPAQPPAAPGPNLPPQQ